MDNLASHKCLLVKEIVKKYDQITALYIPSTTPEFSPIENLFGKIKQKLRSMEFINKEQVASEVSSTMFSMSSYDIGMCFQKSIHNMERFYKDYIKE